jgi:putative flippase GtrA
MAGRMRAMPDALPAGKGVRGLPPPLKFLIAGSANTLFSILVYQVLLFVIGHVAAYAVAYLAGIAVAYYLYARHVFDAPMAPRRFVLFTLFYLLTGLLGTLVNASLIEYLGLHARAAIFGTVAFMLPVNYVGSRWCLRGGAKKD